MPVICQVLGPFGVSVTTWRSARCSIVATSDSSGTDSRTRYTVCTGPSPCGGAYMIGKPGSASTVERPSTRAMAATSTAITSRISRRTSDVPSSGSSATGHGTCTCAGAGESMSACRWSPLRGGKFVVDRSTDVVPAPPTVHGVPTALPFTAHWAYVMVEGRVTAVVACPIDMSQPRAMTSHAKTEPGADVRVPSDAV